MKAHRFIGSFDFNNSMIKVHDQEFLNQVKNVLRLKIGELFVLCDGKMNEAEAKIKEFKKDFVEVEILKTMQNKNEPEKTTVLYCSVLKKENFEWVVQKATEIGVKEIMPVLAKRTVKMNLRSDRLEKIIREASEQSGRGIVPRLHSVAGFEAALNHAKENNQVNFFLDVSGHGIDNSKPTKLQTGVFVGPEGGWDNSEIEKAQEIGFEVVSLSKLILRAETAAILGVYSVLV